MPDVSRVEIHYVDLAGFLRRVEIPYPGEPDKVSAAFDGSSVVGFTSIEKSDLRLEGDPDTYAEIPWMEGAARIMAFVRLPDGSEYPRDPRTIAERVYKHLVGDHGLEPKAGVEVEFFLFSDVTLDMEVANTGLGYSVESPEYPWLAPSFGVVKRAYHSVEPVDTLAGFRFRLARDMAKLGFPVETTHHEVALAQVEASVMAGTPLYASDAVITLKWAARVLAAASGLSAVFLPKPVYGDNGSGMHLHLSLWRGGENLFYSEEGISQTARYFIGGILEHAKSLAAIVAPTTNSYRRLVPGYEAPVYITWGFLNRSAMIRVPAARSPAATRVEFRAPDPTANPYLALAATFLAGLDGVKKKIDPGDPLEKNAYTLTEEERKRLGIETLPKTLDEALDELESDNEYLKPVIDKDTLETYIEIKRAEAEQVRSRPHPYEFYLYGAL